jgi:hypothetical protein
LSGCYSNRRWDRNIAGVVARTSRALGRSKAEAESFIKVYRSTPLGMRLRRGPGRMPAEQPDTVAFFRRLDFVR